MKTIPEFFSNIRDWIKDNPKMCFFYGHNWESYHWITSDILNNGDRCRRCNSRKKKYKYLKSLEKNE